VALVTDVFQYATWTVATTGSPAGVRCRLHQSAGSLNNPSLDVDLREHAAKTYSGDSPAP
jgi:hypothetical protein